jgi:hypothetical protein
VANERMRDVVQITLRPLQFAAVLTAHYCRKAPPCVRPSIGSFAAAEHTAACTHLERDRMLWLGLLGRRIL